MSRLKRRIAVLGGGFGLYGWLAMLSTRDDVLIQTLERYKRLMSQRLDLSKLIGSVDQFHPEDWEAARNADAIVCARRPQDQETLVRELLARGWAGELFLEKPLATNPRKALSLLGDIERGNCRLTLGLTIAQTHHYQDVKRRIDAADGCCNAKIEWHFMAHHFRTSIDTWKRDATLGGGVSAFYASHWFQLAGKYSGDANALVKKYLPDQYLEAHLRNGELQLHLTVNANAASQHLKYEFNGKPIHKLDGPFDSSQRQTIESLQSDPRTTYLERLYNDSLKRRVPIQEEIRPQVEWWNAISEASVAL